MATTKKCSCEHQWMDEQYGTGMRIMNKTSSADKLRCTVCGKDHSVSGSTKRK